MTGVPAPRVMLVDDHPIVRRGVRHILSDAFPEVSIEEVGSGKQAMALAHATRWDLMILDLGLPDCSGFDVLKQVRERQAQLPVLVLSLHAPQQFARRVMSAGASGYLAKEAADEELVTAVTRLLRGGRYFDDVLEEPVGPDRARQPHERLSDREYQVLTMIAGGRTVSEIAASLALSVKTVSTYRARVLEKMALRTNAELTRYAVNYKLTAWLVALMTAAG